MSWYFTLLVCGLFLIGAEVFVPGGVLGIFGAAALIGAAFIGFSIFPAWLGWLSLFFILGTAGLAVWVWMRYFPKSPIGRALSLGRNITKRDQDDSPWKPGMKGSALSSLRPAGKALLNGTRADVIADGTWIEPDAPIEVIKVEGNRIYVRKTDAEG